MANLAFQVTGFAFQGIGQFAFQGSIDAVDDAQTGTGGLDPGEGVARRSIFKPTGLLHVPRKEGRKDVAQRVDESRQIQAEIAERLAREFGEETLRLENQPISQMTMAQVEVEIGVRLRAKLRRDDEELLLLLLVAAAVT